MPPFWRRGRVSRSVEAVSLGAACGRSVGARSATAGRRRGQKKEIVPKVADNLLISPDSLPKMEGNGSNFGSFLSSRTRPGRAYDAFWRLRARRDTNAAFRRGGPWECLGGRSISPETRKRRRNGLKTFNSRREMVWPRQPWTPISGGGARAANGACPATGKDPPAVLCVPTARRSRSAHAAARPPSWSASVDRASPSPPYRSL